MKRLNLSSVEGFSVSYDLQAIKNVEHGKAKKFHTKADCEGTGLNFLIQ